MGSTTSSVTIGRPTNYSPELSALIFDRLASGQTLQAIAKAGDSFPAFSVMFRWMNEHEPFRDMYARARAIRAHARFEKIDEVIEDMRAKTIDAQMARVEIDAIKWMCAKELPHTYGDHQQVDHTLTWAGDPTKLSEGQLAQLIITLEQLAVAAKASEQAQLGSPVTVEAACEVMQPDAASAPGEGTGGTVEGLEPEPE